MGMQQKRPGFMNGHDVTKDDSEKATAAHKQARDDNASRCM